MHRNIQLYVDRQLSERFACMRMDDGCGKCKVRFRCYTCGPRDEINVSMTHGEYTKWWNDKKKRPHPTLSYFSKFYAS